MCVPSSRGSKALLVSALCVCALAAVALHQSSLRTVLAAGAPYGGYWGGYYDAGYYGAYNNPAAYDVARQDYWAAMNAYDAAGVWSYNDWVEQRRDWDRAGYGYGPYDSVVHADYWRSADQNGWGDQTRYNSYLSAYNMQAGGEYPYGFPSIESNYEWQGGGYPSIADNYEQRGGLYRRASDMKDSNHQGSDLIGQGYSGRALREDEGKHTVATKAEGTSALAQTASGKHAKTHWLPMAYKQLATVHLNKKPAAPPKLEGLAEAREAYKRASATFRHAHPGATYRQWLEATAKWDQFFVADRVLDTEQVQLDERKAAALKAVLPAPAFPALSQLDAAEEERVHVPKWVSALHLAPVCKSTVLKQARGKKPRRWQDTQACQLCRDEGTDCDKCAADAKQMLCDFVTMSKPFPNSQLHFTPMGATDVRFPEHGMQLTQIKAEAREERDVAMEKSEEKAAKDYPMIDAALAPLNAMQARLNSQRVKLYVYEFGDAALRLLNGPAASAHLPHLPELFEAMPGYLRWHDPAEKVMFKKKVREASDASSAPGFQAVKGPTQMLSQAGASKLMRLGVNLGGNPLEPPRRRAQGASEGARVNKKMRTLLYPATSGTDHYAAPGAFHANCGQGSPTKLCDNGVFVNEQVALPSEVFLISFFRPSLLPPSSVPPRHSHAPRDGASNGLKPVLGGFICSVCQGTDFLGVAFPRFATPRHLQMQGQTHAQDVAIDAEKVKIPQIVHPNSANSPSQMPSTVISLLICVT